MKHFYPKFTPVLALAIMGGSAFQSEAKLNLTTNPAFLKTHKEAKTVREFRGEKPWNIKDFETEFSKKFEVSTRGAVAEPDVKLEGLGNFDFLEGPDNTTWFYSAEYEKDIYEVSEWYSEEFITAYKFTIYDSSFKEVGIIQDKITLEPGETKIAYASLDPALSRFFFNEDDNVEAMVYIAVNTSIDFGYEMHYYNKVYSIGGEKDAEGNDICIDILPGRCVDALNTSPNGEKYFFTFVDEVYPDPEDFDDYLEYINAAKTIVSVYAKGADGKPALAFEKDIFLTCYPGDTTDGIYMITRSENGLPYFIFSYYEKPYFIDPTGFATDESATPDNNLLIETLTYEEGKLIPVSLTKIPVEIPEADGQVAYYFYSIGSLTWKNDIDTKVNGSLKAPAYIVARDYTTAAQLEDVVSNYYVYGNDGKPIHTLGEEVDGISILNSEEGDEPHALFVTIDPMKGYTFNFVDLYSAKTLFSLYQDNGGDPLSAACQRVKGSDGKYKYAFEMEYDELDQKNNDIKRICWFDGEGKFDHIDHLNMGQNVMYAVVNMYPECLKPDLFDTDDAMEYAILVKRAYGPTTRNEFLITDDVKEFYAQFTADDGKGEPLMFSIIPGNNYDCLQMVYNENDNFNIDVYYLPFTAEAGIDDVVSDKDPFGSNITFNGTSIQAPGCFIEVLNTSGLIMASGKDSVSIELLPKGIYVGRIKDPAGKVYSLKVAF